MPSKLAVEIRNARHAARLTQAQLGTRLGLKARAVYRWERNDSCPTKRHQRALVLAIQAVNPQAAIGLAALIGSVGAAPTPTVVSATAQPAIDRAATLRSAIYQAADELDVPARQMRVALVQLFRRLRQAGLTLESAGQQVEQLTADVP
jgi:DNA-binding XRE family transcriptional regulator